MCLLVVLSRAHPDGPLVVGANRDELLARPATAMEVLVPSGPRVLGGRDLRAGGTWMAVNEHGVVAALTNRPTPDGPPPGRRSRGELPLALARYATADEAAAAFVRAFHPADYGPCWLLVGDRRSLHYLDMTDPAAARVEALPPGLHVLENRPLGTPSPKVAWVRAALHDADRLRGPAILARLAAVLASHEVPPGADADRPAAIQAACVHAGRYGTRSSEVVVVPADPAAPPAIHVADGPPCTAAFAPAAVSFR